MGTKSASSIAVHEVLNEDKTEANNPEVLDYNKNEISSEHSMTEENNPEVPDSQSLINSGIRISFFLSHAQTSNVN